MSEDHKSRLIEGLGDGLKYVTSRRMRPIFKGTLAYVGAYVLIFTRKFDDLSRYPLAFSSMFIVTLAFGAGKPLGACWQAVALGMLGVLTGCAYFAILARMAPYYVAQAVVFALIVYAMSLVKARGQRWFSFSLLSILMAFNGIYTSLLLKGVFDPTYLLEYLKAYSWGAAIVLAVNMLVFPRTSERELRKTIVTSLEHLATLAALIGKAYTLTGTPEDKAARELLSRTVKADFTFLTQKIEETSVEINWSKYSMQDYQRFTDRIRMLQRALLTAHISLLRFDDKDVEIFESNILPRTKTEFLRLRRDIDLTIREVGKELGYGPMYIKATQVGYLDCLDQQRAADNAGQAQPQSQNHVQDAPHPHGRRLFSRYRSQDAENNIERGNNGDENGGANPNTISGLRSSDKVQEDLAAVSKRLQEELGAETPIRPESIPPESRGQNPSGIATPASPLSPTVVPTTVGTSASTRAPGSPIKTTSLLPKHWKHPHDGTSTKGETTKAEAGMDDSKHGPKSPSSKSKITAPHPQETSPPKSKYGPTIMKQHFEEFQMVQRDVFVELLTSTYPGDDARLMLHEPGPSILEMYGGDRLNGTVEEGDLNSRLSRINDMKGFNRLLDLQDAHSPRSRVRTSRPFPFNLLPFADPLADLDVEKGKRKSRRNSDDSFQGTEDEDNDDFDDDEAEELRKQKVKEEQDENQEDHRAKGKGKDDDDSSSIGPTPEFKNNETLVRVYSLMFAWDRFIQNLNSLHNEAKKERTSRIHFHVYEHLVRPGTKTMPEPDGEPDMELHHYRQKKEESDVLEKKEPEPNPDGTYQDKLEKVEDNGKNAEKGDAKGRSQRAVEARQAREEAREEARELSIKEALALLENKPYTRVKTPWLQRVVRWNKWLASEKSIFAGKCAAAASVFAALIFAETTRQWFISYTLTSGLLTCVVALAPTLGQSLMTFVLQISGSGFGTLFGWTVLQMFKDVGGHHYNPYGICAIMTIVAIPLQYLIYERPQFFVLGLLALNSAGSIITTEHVYVNYQHTAHFDTPALRAGKSMVSLGVALAIVITFQLFVLRRPARSRLRKQMGKLVYANLAYNTILQAYVRAVLPADSKYRCKPSVLKRVERELKHRESKMQNQILELSPLIAYAAAEPAFGKPFRGDLAQTLIQANQIILDRLREGRAAIGDMSFEPFILENMVAVLSPYRRRGNRINKVGLYQCAMSLMSKSPLPHDSVLAQHVMNHFVHDALLLSSRLARTKEGAKAVKGDCFCRYWFYLLSVVGLQTQIKRIEVACKELFGELEDDPRLQ